MVNKDKLVSFPEEILSALEDYKVKTGRPATDYIRSAVIRKMIEDKLIFIRMKYITFEEKKKKVKKISIQDAVELNKFCDGDKCEVSALAMKQ